MSRDKTSLLACLCLAIFSPERFVIPAPCNLHMDYQAILNELAELDPKREVKDDDFYTIEESRQELLQAAPWRLDPDYFKNVQISSLALVKMAMHARSGGTNEVMGVMTGKIQDRTFVVLDAYPLPVEATETRVNAMGEAYEYMVQYLNSLDKVGRTEALVGWYHSHPAYGCWLSRIDVDTQKQNQQFQDPFLAIVIDPNRTVANGEVEIGAFRTYPEGHQARAAPANAEAIGEYGLYANEYYPLDVSYFRTSLDEPLFDLVWNRYWSSLLSENKLMVERGLNLQKTQDIVNSIVSLHPTRRNHEKLPFKNLLTQVGARSQADVGALVAMKARNSVFSGDSRNADSLENNAPDTGLVDQSDVGEAMDTEEPEEPKPVYNAENSRGGDYQLAEDIGGDALDDLADGPSDAQVAETPSVAEDGTAETIKKSIDIP